MTRVTRRTVKTLHALLNLVAGAVVAPLAYRRRRHEERSTRNRSLPLPRRIALTADEVADTLAQAA
jgi:hypothetical protein